MAQQRFRAVVTAGPGGRALITVPFDPDETWGAKAAHHVNGTVNGCRVRVTIAPGEGGWAFPLNPAWLRDGCVAVGDEVIVELRPEGPQRGDLADDIAAALAADPAAAAFFDTLAQFYRKAYLRWIDSTTRRPDLRAARIEEVVGLLAADPAAAAFFDTLAQFYRKAYLRWIDATTRRPDVRAARIAEVVDLLAAGVKERPRS